MYSQRDSKGSTVEENGVTLGQKKLGASLEKGHYDSSSWVRTYLEAEKYGKFLFLRIYLRWLYHVSSKNIPKFKMFQIFLATPQICGIYSLNFFFLNFGVIALIRKGKY